MFFRKKPTPWYKKVWMKVTVVVAFIGLSPVGIYEGLIRPDFTKFEDSKFEAVLEQHLLAVIATTDSVPNVGLTVEYSVGEYVVMHRHYPEGLPRRKGLKYAEGREEHLEPIPITFALEEDEVTIRYVFQGWQTLGLPVTFVFKAPIYYHGGNDEEATSSSFKYGVNHAVLRNIDSAN